MTTVYVALYFRGPKLSHLEHAKQFHGIVFMISGVALTSYRVLQLQHLSYNRVGSSFFRQKLGKAHLELLVHRRRKQGGEGGGRPPRFSG